MYERVNFIAMIPFNSKLVDKKTNKEKTKTKNNNNKKTKSKKQKKKQNHFIYAGIWGCQSGN